MNAEEFYEKVKADAGLQKALEEATDSGKLAEFLTASGCTASVEDFSACVAAHE
ncbi:MAG: hypothetical protein IJP61_03295 [Treponema sp.]|nr:hypothetical protein [Treponema sp.]